MEPYCVSYLRTKLNVTCMISVHNSGNFVIHSIKHIRDNTHSQQANSIESDLSDYTIFSFILNDASLLYNYRAFSLPVSP